MADVNFIADYKDTAGAELAAKASNRELDILGNKLTQIEFPRQMPLTAQAFMKRLTEKRPSINRCRQIAGLRQHFNGDEWFDTVNELSITNWSFSEQVEKNIIKKTGFLMEALQVNPFIVQRLLSYRPTLESETSEQLLHHLYKHYSRALESGSRNYEILGRAITMLESSGARLRSSATYLYTFTQLPQDSEVFKYGHSYYRSFLTEITRLDYLRRVENLTDLPCLAHRTHHADFVKMISDFWVEECQVFFSEDLDNRKQDLADALATTCLLLNKLPKEFETPPALVDLCEQLIKKAKAMPQT
ncbi:hypothetical protein [Vibrio mediterranei]|uniref:hypothetical protein n=1 Tax=Vibrio mediterranei TaxID=689 RepID=UPI004068FB08